MLLHYSLVLGTFDIFFLLRLSYVDTILVLFVIRGLERWVATTMTA